MSLPIRRTAILALRQTSRTYATATASAPKLTGVARSADSSKPEKKIDLKAGAKKDPELYVCLSPLPPFPSPSC